MAWRGYACAALDDAIVDLGAARRRAASAADARLGGENGPVDASLEAVRALVTERHLQQLVRAGGVTLRPGAAAFLAACAARGPVGIVSALPRPLAEGVLDGAGVGDAIAFLWCGAERGADPWRRAAARPVGAGRSRVAIVGDASAAVAAARAGFAVVHVGEGDGAALPAGTVPWPDFVGRTPDDLAELPSPRPK